MRVLLHPREEGHAGAALVSTTILHAAVLHQLQHQFFAVRHVWHYVPSLPGTDAAEGHEEHD